MKLNNKGISLVELLISILLVGIVLLFLFQLISDLKNETNNNEFAYNNQVNRTELIYKIQKDLSNNAFVGIEDLSGDNIEIWFRFKQGAETKTAKLISSYKEENILGGKEKIYYFTYEDVNGNKDTWEMKGAAIDPCGLFTFYTDADTSNYYLKLNINIYNYVYHSRNNPNNNNPIDDIEITHSGPKSLIDTSDSDYLTYSNKAEQKVGVCNNNVYIEHLLNVRED